ncbi:MAG: hypothetical protein R3F35_11975 [Myxococcota bacterium]
MTSQAAVEIFERAVAARARVLRVEADRPDASPGVLVLTFDVGRVVVRSSGIGLAIETIEERSALPGGLVPLDEEEPWWRILGQSITAVWPVGAAAEQAAALTAVKLRFREGDQNPRIVAVSAAERSLRVALEGN